MPEGLLGLVVRDTTPKKTIVSPGRLTVAITGGENDGILFPDGRGGVNAPIGWLGVIDADELLDEVVEVVALSLAVVQVYAATFSVGETEVADFNMPPIELNPYRHQDPIQCRMGWFVD